MWSAADSGPSPDPPKADSTAAPSDEIQSLKNQLATSERKSASKRALSPESAPSTSSLSFNDDNLTSLVEQKKRLCDQKAPLLPTPTKKHESTRQWNLQAMKTNDPVNHLAGGDGVGARSHQLSPYVKRLLSTCQVLD